MKRENGDGDGDGHGHGSSFDKNNTADHRSPYTFDDLTLPESPIYNSASNSNSSSSWSLSSASFNESTAYCNRDYRISPSFGSSPTASSCNNTVFQPFLSN